jgi:hypothetical protein
MLIYLNDYRKAKAKKEVKLPVQRLNEELLCVNWNPAFGVIALSSFQRPQELSPELPLDYEPVKTAFIHRVSALASQI